MNGGIDSGEFAQPLRPVIDHRGLGNHRCFWRSRSRPPFDPSPIHFHQSSQNLHLINSYQLYISHNPNVRVCAPKSKVEIALTCTGITLGISQSKPTGSDQDSASLRFLFNLCAVCIGNILPFLDNIPFSVCGVHSEAGTSEPPGVRG